MPTPEIKPTSPTRTLSRYFTVWRDLARSYRRLSYVRWITLGVVVGVISGFAAALFFLGVEAGKHFFLTTLAGFELPSPAGERLLHGEPGPFRPWLIPALTTLVGLVTGWLVTRFIPDSIHGGTDGTDSMIKAFHRQEGRIKPRVPIIKGIMAVFTISTGCSAGREGPISQIGAGIGSWLATKLNLSTRERRILLLAGAAGGLGAIFRAPLGGALTAIEVIYREDFESEAILPSVLSSVVAYSIFTLFYGTEPIFAVPTFKFVSILELPFYTVLAVACAITGWFYVRTFYFLKYQVFWRIQAKVGIMWTMALGGLAMGCFGIAFPAVLTGGYGWLEQAILGQLPIMLMVAIIIGKTLATSMTIGSGMSGGMFAPALFVGGMTGGLIGELSHQFYPQIITQSGGFVMVGMAAFFAGVANAPIGPMIMVTELTKGYGLLAPLMLASALCLVLARKVSLYENQVEDKFESPAHIEDATINILEDLQVKDFYKPEQITVLEESMTLKELLDIIANTNDFTFPVRGADDNITGLLPLQDVRKILFEDCLMDLIVVRDVMRKPSFLNPMDDLYQALLKFVDTGYEQIPVLDPENETKVLGVINREDVFQAYSQTLTSIKEST